MPAPTSLLPVNDTALTASDFRSASPIVDPEPSTMLSTPRGTPARSKIETTWADVSGVRVAGLKTTVLPETSAGAIFHTGMATGKFQGVMQATTPTGWRTV